jgi:hypothetical protein
MRHAEIGRIIANAILNPIYCVYRTPDLHILQLVRMGSHNEWFS